ncbi:MAG: (2Fe-2S)-binding protein [Anaerolineae bacterium]
MADEAKNHKGAAKVPDEEPPLKISRRNFLVGAGAATGALAGGLTLAPAQAMELVEEAKVAAKLQPEARPAAAVQTASEPISGKTLIVLNVNGRDYEVAVEPQNTLAEVLRRDLGLTGTHIGCNGSYCGNCTVLLDGVAENSCSLLAIREAGRKITTIEGLEQEGQLHPVQQAFWQEMGYQCGFCTSGQIMRAVELLNNVKEPTEAQIRRHMSGNMCKCSAYPNILKAIQEAAKLMA